MTEPVVRVPRREAERIRRQLADTDSLAHDRRILEEDGWVYLPVRPGIDRSLLPGEPIDRALPSMEPPPVRDYRELLAGWSADDRALLPRSYDVIGEIALIRLPPGLAARGAEVGEALRRFVPGVRRVGADYGVHGPARRRRVEPLAGSGPWRTRYRENGIEFEVDVEQAYFSPRLAREHARVAARVRPGERVYDLCCGVGPFAMTIARDGRAATITAVDSNPAAIALLRASRARYPWAERIEPREASVERFSESAPPVERVILNLPHEGIKYVPRVATLVTSGGELQYYEVVDRGTADRRPAELVATLAGSGRWSVRERHVVHPYSPGADLIAFTLVREEA